MKQADAFGHKEPKIPKLGKIDLNAKETIVTRVREVVGTRYVRLDDDPQDRMLAIPAGLAAYFDAAYKTRKVIRVVVEKKRVMGVEV